MFISCLFNKSLKTCVYYIVLLTLFLSNMDKTPTLSNSNIDTLEGQDTSVTKTQEASADCEFNKNGHGQLQNKSNIWT